MNENFLKIITNENSHEYSFDNIFKNNKEKILNINPLLLSLNLFKIYPDIENNNNFNLIINKD